MGQEHIRHKLKYNTMVYKTRCNTIHYHNNLDEWHQLGFIEDDSIMIISHQLLHGLRQDARLEDNFVIYYFK